jgi:hypothetical protein
VAVDPSTSLERASARSVPCVTTCPYWQVADGAPPSSRFRARRADAHGFVVTVSVASGPFILIHSDAQQPA